MVRTLKTPSGMTGVGPSIERVQMFQSPSDVIQLALTPVFLLTAVAALLNVFSTRLGRVADRVDLLSADLQRGAADTEFICRTGFSAETIAHPGRGRRVGNGRRRGNLRRCACFVFRHVKRCGIQDSGIRSFWRCDYLQITALVTFAIEMIMAGLGLRGVVRTMKTADQNKSDSKTC